MMLPKVTKHIFLEKTMSQKKSARFTGPKKKALDFSKTVRLNKGTLFFVRKEVQAGERLEKSIPGMDGGVE